MAKDRRPNSSVRWARNINRRMRGLCARTGGSMNG